MSVNINQMNNRIIIIIKVVENVPRSVRDVLEHVSDDLLWSWGNFLKVIFGPQAWPKRAPHPPQKRPKNGGWPCRYFQKFWSDRYDSKNFSKDLSYADSEKNLTPCTTSYRRIMFQEFQFFFKIDVFWPFWGCIFFLFFKCQTGTKIHWYFHNFHSNSLEPKYLSKGEIIFDSGKIFGVS